MNIIEAVHLAKTTKKVRRKEWFYISPTHCNYIYGVKGPYGQTCVVCQHNDGVKDDEPAKFNADDVLANDWVEVVCKKLKE